MELFLLLNKEYLNYDTGNTILRIAGKGGKEERGRTLMN